jgi:hypothetical protein
MRLSQERLHGGIMYQVSDIIQSLRVADSLTVGEIFLAKGLYSNLQSARVNAQKKLNELVALGQLEKADNYYRTPDCKSEYKEHARLLTKVLAELFKLPSVEPVIYREITTPVGLRPDAIVLLTKENQGLCLILEVLINETEAYFQMKKNTWDNWPEATRYLSELFNYKIPNFELLPITVLDGFISFLKEAI